MNLIQLLVNSLALVSVVLTYELQEPSLTFSTLQETLHIPTMKSGNEKSFEPIIIDSLDEVIQFKFKLKGKQPSQLSLLLGSISRDLETNYYPMIQDELVEFKIPIINLPKSLMYYATQENDTLTATLILADEGCKDNLLSEVFNFKLNVPFDTKSFKLPKRFEKKDEIYHIFRDPPKTIKPIFAQVFQFIVISCLIGLLSSWFTTGAILISGLPSGLNFFYFIGFIGSIIGLEYIFIQYYLDTSIFTTLKHTFVTAILSIVFGSKLLRYMARMG